MIVTCPNCSARYRLADEAMARGARLRCAACEHRWVPVASGEDEYLVPRADPTSPPPAPEPADPPTPARPEAPRAASAAIAVESSAAPQLEPDGDDADEHDDDDSRRSPLLRTVIALVLGLALAIAAAGLWAGQIDLSRLPMVGPALAEIAPPPSALTVTVTGTVTRLPAGGRVLEVSGTVSNPGKRTETVPFLKASLSGPVGAVRRWMIAPSATRLRPGESATFDSTVTGFPGDARTLSVTPGR